MTQQRCELPGEDLVAYAEGSLRGAKLEWAEAHLRVCSACQDRLTAFGNTARVLQAATPHVDEPACRAAVRVRVEQRAIQSGRRGRLQPQPRTAVVLAALALALLAASTAQAGRLGMGLRFPIGQVPELLLGQPAQEEMVATPPLENVALRFPAVEPLSLPFGLQQVQRTAPSADTVQLFYENPSGLVILLVESPGGPARMAAMTGNVAQDESVTRVLGTEVLWHEGPQGTNVSGLYWEYHGVFFELLVVESPPGPRWGLPHSEALRIMQAVMEAQDASRQR